MRRLCWASTAVTAPPCCSPPYPNAAAEFTPRNMEQYENALALLAAGGDEEVSDLEEPSDADESLYMDT